MFGCEGQRIRGCRHRSVHTDPLSKASPTNSVSLIPRSAASHYGEVMAVAYLDRDLGDPVELCV